MKATPVYYLASPSGLLLAEIGGGAGLFPDSETLWTGPDASAILTYASRESAEHAARALSAVHGPLIVCGPRNPIPLWQREFPDFGPMPAQVADLLAKGTLIDLSWHNDICPNFIRATDQAVCDAEGLDRVWSLWVDYADPSQREIPEWPRFRVCAPTYESAFTSENEGEAIAFLLARPTAKGGAS